MAAGLHSARFMPPTVLTVDPEEDLLATYYRLISRRGYRVMTASTRAAGLRAVEREAPSLVISDLRLPDGDGLDIVRAARSRVPPAVAIVVSALSAEPSRQTATAAGASDFLHKPFESAALLDLIQSHVPMPLPARG